MTCTKLLPLHGLDRVFTVRAFYRMGPVVRRFEKSFTDLERARKFKLWMMVNTEHQDVRVENESLQVVG